MSDLELSGTGHFATELKINAPRARVWQAFATHADFSQWFNHDPAWYLNVPRFDFRLGGGFRAEFGPTEHIYTEVCLYEEIDDHRRIVMSSEMTEGTPYLCTRVTLTFEDDGNATRLTARENGIPDGDIEDRREGWGLTLNNLKRYLEI